MNKKNSVTSTDEVVIEDSFILKDTYKKQKLGRNQESLDFKNSELEVLETPINFGIAIDIGSTGTRFIPIINKKSKKIIEIDSVIGIPTLSLNSVRADYVFESLCTEVHSEGTNVIHKISHGTITDKLRGEIKAISSVVPKIEDDVTFFNVINAAFFGLVSTKKIPRKAKVRVYLAIPPGEVYSEISKNKFIKRLTKVHEVSYLGFKCALEIEDVMLFGEPEALVNSFHGVKEIPEIENNQKVMLIDGGGRSFGVALADQHGFSGEQKLIDLGGQTLINACIPSVRNFNQLLSRITYKDIAESISNGLIKVSGNVINIFPVIKEQKDIFAQSLFKELKNIMSHNQWKYTDYDKIYVSGGTFGYGEYVDAEGNPCRYSISQKFSQLICEDAKTKIEVIVLSSQLIPLGIIETLKMYNPKEVDYLNECLGTNIEIYK